MKFTSNVNLILIHFYLYTGPNRAKKTTKALQDSVKLLIENPQLSMIVLVARTEKNLGETLQTIKNHIKDVERNKITITEVVGKAKLCPYFFEFEDFYKDVDWNVWKNTICGKCNKKKFLMRHVKDEIYRTRVMDKETATKFLRHKYTCPWNVVREHFKYNMGKKHIVLCTYAGLDMIYDDIKNHLRNTVFIFDEAHNIPEMCKIYQEKINKKGTKKSFEKIIGGYLTQLENLKSNVDYLKLKKNDKLKRNIDKLIKYLGELGGGYSKAKVIEKYHQLLIDRSLDKKIIKEYHELVSQGKDDEEFISKIAKPKFEPDQFMIQNLANKLLKKNQSSKRKLQRLFMIARMVKMLEDEKNVICLDLVDDEHGNRSVSLYVIRMDGDAEDRRQITDIIENSFGTYLVTSTPYPEKWYPFWLGKDYSDKLKVVNFPMPFDFNIVVENSVKAKVDIWKDRSNTEREMNIDNGILIKLGKPLHYFARSKGEHNNLLKYLDTKSEYIHYARGSDTEGVQLKGYTCPYGFPLQNISSDGFRKWVMGRVVGINPQKAIREYRDMRALMELVQETFRTADVNMLSGSIWRHISEDVYIKSREIWTWLSDVNWIILGKEKGHGRLKAEEKIKFMVDGLILGERPKYTTVQMRIKRDFEEFLKKSGEVNSTNLISNVRGDENTKREVLNIMKAEGLVTITGEKFPLTKKVKLVGKP